MCLPTWWAIHIPKLTLVLFCVLPAISRCIMVVGYKTTHLKGVPGPIPPLASAGRLAECSTEMACVSNTIACSFRRHLSLRGGGLGAGAGWGNTPHVPAEAVGILSANGLQLRAVNWPEKHDGPGSSDDDGPEMSDEVGVEDEHDVDGEQSDDSTSVDDVSGEGSPEPEAPEVTPAQAQLWEACRRGDDKAIYQAVRTMGADINAQDPTFGLWTACHYAACVGRSRVIQILWALGADINARNRAGATPLFLAAAEGHVSLVRKLAVSGSNVNATNRQGSSALHHAALNGCTRTCEKLLSLGADVDPPNCLGVTPLHMAVAGVQLVPLQPFPLSHNSTHHFYLEIVRGTHRHHRKVARMGRRHSPGQASVLSPWALRHDGHSRAIAQSLNAVCIAGLT
jgi:hypothetical protein